MSSTARVIVPLQQQCILYVVSHIHEFFPHELALLPRHIRCGLLRQIPPILLFHLEQTSVADGVDTVQIWREVSQRPRIFETREDLSSAAFWDNYTATGIESGLVGEVLSPFAFRDHYITTVWHTLMKDKAFQAHQHDGVTFLQIVFAFHSMVLPVTVDAIKHWTWFSPLSNDYIVLQESPVHSRSELAAYLVKIGAFPDWLDIQSGDMLEELWQCNRIGVLQQVLSRSKIRNLMLQPVSSNRDEYTSLILKTILCRPQPLLQSLKLWNVSINVILSIVHFLSGAESHTSLKELEFHISQQACGPVGSSLMLIISNQTALETVVLEGITVAFPSGLDGELLVSVLSSLIVQPQFSSLTVGGFKDVPLNVIKSLTEAFTCSSMSVKRQQLVFSCLDIEMEQQDKSISNSQSTKRFKEVITIKKVTRTLQEVPKHIKCICTNIPFAFLEWFSCLECVHLNSLELSSCGLDLWQVKRQFKHHKMQVY